MKINRNKNIGNVLFIVEGSKTEFYILYQIFTKIFKYSYETIKRSNGYKYKKYFNNNNKNSRIFVINAKESNIKFIKDGDEFLDQLFIELIDKYKFPVDKASIYYIFDRDDLSNTDQKLVIDLTSKLKNALDNDEYRPGLLLFSYPSIESFVTQSFTDITDNKYKCSTGHELKQLNRKLDLNQQNIDEESLLYSNEQMLKFIMEIVNTEFNIDDLGPVNLDVLNFQEESRKKDDVYWIVSLLTIALIDLGLIVDEGID